MNLAAGVGGMFQLLWSNLRTCSPKVYSRFFAEIVLALLHSANKSLAVAPRQWCHPKLSTSTQHRRLCVLIWELQLLDGTALPFPSLDRNFAWIVLDVPGGKNGLQVGTDLQVIFSMPKSRNTYKGDAKISLQQPSTKKTAPFSWELKGLQLTLVWKNDWRIGCNVVATSASSSQPVASNFTPPLKQHGRLCMWPFERVTQQVMNLWLQLHW